MLEQKGVITMARDNIGVDDTEMGSYGARDGDKGYMDDDMEAELDTDTS